MRSFTAGFRRMDRRCRLRTASYARRISAVDGTYCLRDIGHHAGAGPYFPAQTPGANIATGAAATVSAAAFISGAGSIPTPARRCCCAATIPAGAAAPPIVNAPLGLGHREIPETLSDCNNVPPQHPLPVALAGLLIEHAPGIQANAVDFKATTAGERVSDARSGMTRIGDDQNPNSRPEFPPKAVAARRRSTSGHRAARSRRDDQWHPAGPRRH